MSKIRLGKQDLSNLHFRCASKINTNMYFTSFWSKLIYPVIKTILCLLSVNNRYSDLIRAKIVFGKKRKWREIFFDGIAGGGG